MPDGESEDAIYVSVYGVDRSDLAGVRSFINDLDWEYCRDTEYSLVPRVVSRVDTVRYYPQFLDVWESFLVEADWLFDKETPWLAVDETRPKQVSQDRYTEAANAELLRAA
jgi:hypothetical protein